MVALIQNCWIVPDIEQAARGWIAAGVGPFLTMDIDFPEVNYRGKRMPFSISVALAQAGDMQIELITQRSEGPSPYREMVPEGATGFHHVCRAFGDYDATVAQMRAAGIDIVLEAGLGGSRFCYADTRATMGCMYEIVDPMPGSYAMMQMVTDAAAAWDGRTDPIRPHPLFG